MFSQKRIQEMDYDDLIGLIETYVNEVSSRMDNLDDAHDYANSLGLLVDELRERLWNDLQEQEDK
jgi:Mg/Co/Ni transporter MgtE